MSQKLKLQFLGAAGTVTGSKLLLSYDQSQYLFDCGMFQGPKDLRRRNWESIAELQSVKAVILSHAHIDHSGYLPKLVKDGFNGPIYCTPATADLCAMLLRDAAHLQEEDARYANDSKYSRHAPTAMPLFNRDDVEQAIQLLKPVSLHEWHNLSTGISFRFFRAGHILGSAITQISFQSNNQNKILTLTGDLGNGRSEVLEDPENILETDYLVMESTYGDRRQSRESTLDQIENVITKVLGRHGTLIIPAFALGRTQELLYLINKLETDGRIPKYPVYLDSPMANSATDLYLKYKSELKTELRGQNIKSRLSSARYKEVNSSVESMMLCSSAEPKIVISAAGMITGGRILHHLKAKLPDPKSGVLFVGYQAVGTKGMLLKNGLREIRIHHEKINVAAEIFSMDSLSAHADCEDLTKFAASFAQKPKRVFLNHGELSSSQSLQYLLKNELQISAEIATEDIEYTLD